ncbi:beta-1,4-galactosyltransferase 4-like [Styela clava]
MKYFRLSFRLLLIQCIMVLLVIFASFSTYIAWTKTRGINWKKSISWYPRLGTLVQDVDNFFWSIIEMDELSLQETLKNGRNLSDKFVHSNVLLKKSRTLLRSKLEEKNTNPTKAIGPGYIEPDELPLEYCPEYPPYLQGELGMPDYWRKDPPTLREMAKKYPNHKDATNKPFDCKARYRVAIIIPLRGREIQLRGLLSHMLPVWKRQQLDYTVYTITQAGNQLFNRAKLMNVGFSEAIKERKYDCFVFHDVDLLLENDKCLYWCPQSRDEKFDNPRHISTYIDKFGYNVHTYDLGLCSPMAYKNMEVEVFGGVSMFTEEQFVSVNGFSNLYWGWGAEDDDLFMRTWKKGYKVNHDSSGACSFHMIYHRRERKNRKNAIRYLLLKHALSRQNEDGLSNLRYKVLSHEKHSIYTNITVDIGGPSSKLRDLTRKIDHGMADIDDLSCFESLVWMYHNLLKKPK